MNRPAEEPSDDGRKTVLIVEDDPGTQRVLASGLATTLGMFDVLTANHGQEAVELLESHPVDVVVTDLAMPVMDGFALIGYLTNRATMVPVVVLSALAPTTVADGLDGYGGLTVLCKPTGYLEVARAVLEALERHDLGQVAGIPLASVLQLIEAERRTCSLGVTSGRRRGRLHFESGRLINAFSDDFGAEGEAAAYDILTWSRTAIEFEHLPEGIRRTIDIPTQTLLIEVARRQDEQREREARLTPPTPMARPANDAFHAPEPGVDPVAAPDARPDATTLEGSAEDATEDAHAVATEAAPLGDPDPEPDPYAAPEPDAAPDPEAAAATALPAPDPIAVLEPDDPSPETAMEPDLASAAAPVASATVEHATVERADMQLGDVARSEVPSAVLPSEPSPAPSTAPTTAAPPLPSTERHAELVAAIERLTLRVHAADAALAAVADEVDAFQTAQRRYDGEIRRQEERRRAVDAARRDVADLARQILARMDGLFDDDSSERSAAADAPSGDPANG